MDKALFGELIENCGYCIKYMTESNLALENGDILKCQEHSKRAQDLLKSMTNDIFCEVKEILGNEEGVLDYEDATPTELIIQLANVVLYAGSLLPMEQDGSAIYKIAVSCLVKAVNTVTELYNILYANN